jgi:hypothetical protein
MSEHPEDRRMRREAIAEARTTIGPFWRKNWRLFVALVETYADDMAHVRLDALRERYWGSIRPKKGPPPTPPTARALLAPPSTPPAAEGKS